MSQFVLVCAHPCMPFTQDPGVEEGPLIVQGFTLDKQAGRAASPYGTEKVWAWVPSCNTLYALQLRKRQTNNALLLLGRRAGVKSGLGRRKCSLSEV
eukprot:1142261-Pelagomonas_calceolata.AAC.8